MTAQELKNSILQMAVQGKLVPQDPNDEPASILLEKIHEEKEKLIREGKIKREKNPSVIFRGADNTPYEKVGNAEPVSLADEVPFEIPDTWEWIRVRFITELFNGRAFKPTDWTENGLPIVRIQNLNDPNAPYNHYNGTVEDAYLLHGGELLFAWSGTPGTSFGAHIWHGDTAVLNQHIFRLDYLESIIDKRYYMYALNQRVLTLIGAAHGSAGLQHVTKGVFESTLIPLPPVKEQIRIVEILEELHPLTENYDTVQKAVDQLNTSFPDQLRKSILQLAVQGKLVPQETSDEPASVLLERIRAEKERLIREGKIKRDKHESVIYRRDNSHYEKLGGVERCIDDELPFEIPETWCWAHFSDVITIATNLVNPNQYPDHLHIAPDNIEKGTGQLLPCRTVSEDCIKSNNHLFRKGQLLYSKIRPALRKATIAPQDGLCSADMYPLQTSLCSGYVLIYLLCESFTQAVLKEDTRVKMPKVNQETLMKVLVPIPPLLEQERISASVFKSLHVLNAI